MRIFYDTEFNEPTLDLVSIGMVDDGGAEYYAVSAEFDQSLLLSNPWIVANVWPHLPTCPIEPGSDQLQLDLSHPDVKLRSTIAAEVRDFICASADPRLWSWYASFDHVILSRLFGRMTDLPRCVPMFTSDLKQETERLGNPRVPREQPNAHDALFDARHHRDIAHWLDGLTRDLTDVIVYGQAEHRYPHLFEPRWAETHLGAG